MTSSFLLIDFVIYDTTASSMAGNEMLGMILQGSHTIRQNQYMFFIKNIIFNSKYDYCDKFNKIIHSFNNGKATRIDNIFFDYSSNEGNDYRGGNILKNKFEFYMHLIDVCKKGSGIRPVTSRRRTNPGAHFW